MDLPTPAPPGSYPIAHKASKDSLRGSRRAAPAQFIAGSRRPPSRGSLRSESRTSSHSAMIQQPTRPAPGVPSLNDSTSVQRRVSSESAGSEAVLRKSSIPLFRSTVSNIVTHAESKLGPTEHYGPQDVADGDKLAVGDFGIFEDKQDTPEAQAAAVNSSTFDGGPNNHGILAAIEESPHPKYKLKRLSVTSPEHGPTLRISPSADRIIMGSGSNKENSPILKTKRSRELNRVFPATNLRYQPGKGKGPSRPSNQRTNIKGSRPSSSQGIPLSASRTSLMDPDSRAKKVKSADLGSTLAASHLQRLSGTETARSSRNNTSTSTSEDPFFDAQSTFDKRASRLTYRTEVSKDSLLQLYDGLPESTSWVEPVQKHLGLTADSDALLQPADVQSVLTHEGTIHEPEATKEDISAPVKEDVIISRRSSDAPEITPPKATEPKPVRPEHATADNKSGSLPPRSSSRAAHPNFIGNKSPISPLGNKENVPEEFTVRQNRLGSVHGHATSQIDMSNPASKRNSVRNSTANESQKSNNSISKGMLSKVSGLFHKRSSDDSILKSGKKKQKVSINGNGSPFPSISEVHPVHRPTLASMRRAAHTNDKAARSPLPDFSNPGLATPLFASPIPTEVATTTTLAMDILEAARNERSSPRKERLLELGKIMVDALTRARDAERAMEEAKQAARKAEVAYALCKKTCGDVTKLVQEWRDEIKSGGSN